MNEAVSWTLISFAAEVGRLKGTVGRENGVVVKIMHCHTGELQSFPGSTTEFLMLGKSLKLSFSLVATNCIPHFLCAKLDTHGA